MLLSWSPHQVQFSLPDSLDHGLWIVPGLFPVAMLCEIVLPLLDSGAFQCMVSIVLFCIVLEIHINPQLEFKWAVTYYWPYYYCDTWHLWDINIDVAYIDDAYIKHYQKAQSWIALGLSCHYHTVCRLLPPSQPISLF